MSTPLLDDADHAAIDRLQRAYADVVLRRAWDELDPLFTPDAPIRLDLVTSGVRVLDGAAGLRAFLEVAMERFAFLAFVILNSHVEPGTDRRHATARVFIKEERIDHDGAASQTYGLYRDTYVRADRWMIESRQYRSLARLPDGEVFDAPATR